ncbi:MAG: FAD-dependent oxidoreductase [Gracilibacteraceae bacterium]|jgi:succinate dehydrogenase/fumarate reductase flavoprotein subunit|nr:FAD-dependent oxidoreductase [Gracilibacteraceae bacterium]
MSDYEVRNIRTDVLIVGGGLGGLAAAIQARESGAEVVVLEKGHAARSGLAGSGIDHIQAYVPEFHQRIGYTETDLADDQYAAGGPGGLNRRDLAELYAFNSAREIRRLEEYGLRFRYDDHDPNQPEGFRLVPQFHSVPTSYHFDGRDIKRVLSDKALALGVRIFNRAHARELIARDGVVYGAVAVGVREREILAVTAKTTILATSGYAARLTDGGAAGGSFETFGAPTASVGAGKVLAAKAGARVVNLEFFNLAPPGAAFLNFSFSAGAPRGTWWPAGRVVDADGTVIAERFHDLSVDEPDYKAKYKEKLAAAQAQGQKTGRLLAEGRSLYFDVREGTEAELERIWWALGNEGKCGVIKVNLQNNGGNLRDLRIPLRRNQRGGAPVLSGVWVRENTLETSVRNLYASGNEPAGLGNFIPVAGAAVVFGFLSGAQAAARAAELAAPPDFSAAFVAKVESRLAALLAGEDGDSWRDAESALQALLANTLGKQYSEQSVRQAQELLDQLRRSLRLRAPGPHEVSRALEVDDLYDLAELTLTAVRERKSTLGPFTRLDESLWPPEIFGESVAVWYEDGAIRTGRLQNAKS